MAELSLLIAPDYPPRYILDWYRLTIALEHFLARPIHLQLAINFNDFYHYMELNPTLVHVGSYDTAKIMRNYQYLPLARPEAASDEVIIFSDRDSLILRLDDIDKTTKFICLNDVNMQRIGEILLEPRSIYRKEVDWQRMDNYQSILRLVRGSINTVGIMRSNVFHQLSPNLKQRYCPIITSSLSVLFHTMLLSPSFAGEHQTFHKAVQSLNERKDILQGLDMRSIKPMNNEVGLFICDIVDTLV